MSENCQQGDIVLSTIVSGVLAVNPMNVANLIMHNEMRNYIFNVNVKCSHVVVEMVDVMVNILLAMLLFWSQA